MAAVLILAVGCGRPEAPRRKESERSVKSGLVAGSEGAAYTYDAAGNMLEIGPAAAYSVSIADFSPRVGGVGQIIRVLGSGFSPAPASNGVQLGGLPVTVLTSTATELTFVVPAGATTGTITVTRGESSATSTDVFTFVGEVVISGFSPKLGTVGTVLTIDGFNFDPNPALDSVTVGGGSGIATSATHSSLVATVAPGATSGKVGLTTSTGHATSADDFFLLPAGYSEWDIAFADRAIPGTPTTVTVAEPGKAGLVLFDGSQGDWVTLFVRGVTFGSASITIHAPGGATIFSMNELWKAFEYKLELPALPVSGTYTIAVEPAMGGTGQLDIHVLPEVSGDLPRGESTSLALSQGQNGRLTFSGNAGESLGLACSAIGTVPPGKAATLYLVRPDGVQIWSGQVTAATSWQWPVLPSSGSYSLLVKPSGPVGASLTLLLSEPSFGAIAVDGPAVEFQSSVAGQSGKFMFAGAAGEAIGLGVPNLSVSAGTTASFKVLKPDGSSLWSANATGPWGWQLPPLPVTGTYTLSVAPAGSATVAVTLLLSRPISGALVADGEEAIYQTARAGQSGRFTFVGGAGQRFTMHATASSTHPNGVALTVQQPSGAVIASAMLYSNHDRKIDLGVLPASGTYTVVLVPGAANTGQVALRLVSVATDTLVVGDPPKTVSLGAAQNGRYSFSAEAGDWIGLAATALTTVPASKTVTLKVERPDGVVHWSGNASAPGSWSLPQLPVTGTYTLVVQPEGNTGTASASLSLLLSSALTGVLATDGTATRFETARPGQSGRYTFTGSAGQRFTMRVTAGPNLMPGVSVAVYQPSGAGIGWAQAASNSDLKVDLGALPSTGTYTVVVTPVGMTTGWVDLRLVAVAADTLGIGEPAKTLSLIAAQNGRYSFTGSAGDLISLGLSSLITTPPNAYVSFFLYKPDDGLLWSGSATGDKSWALPQLPAAGTYVLVVQPPGTAAASFALQLPWR